MASRVALIPARIGSTRLPQKNLNLFAGKPLIVWTIEAALQSKMFDRVIVSTDSARIQRIAIGAGAEVPFLRPTELSQSDSPAQDVVLHWLKSDPDTEVLAYLQPTSPLRDSEHIVEAMEIWNKNSLHSLTSLYILKSGLSWELGCEDSNGHRAGDMIDRLNPLNREMGVINGAIYVVRRENFLVDESFVTKNTSGYVMDRWDSIDIDYEEDWQVAEFRLIQRLRPAL